MFIILFVVGLIIIFLWLTRMDEESSKEKDRRLEREWAEQDLGSPRPSQRPEVGPFTEAHLRNKGYSEKEVEFMMHNFGDQNAAD